MAHFLGSNSGVQQGTPTCPILSILTMYNACQVFQPRLSRICTIYKIFNEAGINFQTVSYISTMQTLQDQSPVQCTIHTKTDIFTCQVQ